MREMIFAEAERSAAVAAIVAAAERRDEEAFSRSLDDAWRAAERATRAERVAAVTLTVDAEMPAEEAARRLARVASAGGNAKRSSCADHSHGNGELRVGGLSDRGDFRRRLRVRRAGRVDQAEARLVPGHPGPADPHRLPPRRGRPAAAGVVAPGYGEVGFQATGVTFPTDGCRQITGTVGRAVLTFVIFVVIR